MRFIALRSGLEPLTTWEVGSCSLRPETKGRDTAVIRKGDRRDAPSREFREQPILLGVTYADPQARVHLRGSSFDRDES